MTPTKFKGIIIPAPAKSKGKRGGGGGDIIPVGPTFEPEVEDAWEIGGGDFATEFYTDDTAKRTVNDLVVRKKDLHEWDRTVILYPNIGANELQHKINFKNPTGVQYDNNKVYSGDMVHNYLGEKYNGIDTYANMKYKPSEQNPQYSFNAKLMLKENTFGVDDYLLFGSYEGGGILLDMFFVNRFFLSLPTDNDKQVVINPFSDGISGLLMLNLHTFNYVQVWRNGVKEYEDTTDRRGYFTPHDPETDTNDYYLGAANRGNGSGVADFPCQFTFMYTEFGFHMKTDADAIAEDDYIRNTFCPPLFKIAD